MATLRFLSMLAAATVLVGACTDTRPLIPETASEPSPTSTVIEPTALASETEASFLAVMKAGLREIPDLPPATELEWIGFGYQTCDRIEAAVSNGVEPKSAAEEAVLDARLPGGQVDGGKGDVLIVRNLLQQVAAEYLCPESSNRAWASSFHDGIFEAMQSDPP